MANILKDGMYIPASVPVMIKTLEAVFAEDFRRRGNDETIKITLSQHMARVYKPRSRGDRLCLVVTEVTADCEGSEEVLVHVVEDNFWWNVILQSTKLESGHTVYRPYKVEACCDKTWNGSKAKHVVTTFYFDHKSQIARVVDTNPD